MGVDHIRDKIRVRYHLKKAIRKNKCKRSLVRSAVPKKLQKLFACCLDVFKGPGTVPAHGDVQNLSSLLNNMKPEDVGLNRNLQFSKPNESGYGISRVTSTTIYSCQNFSLCLFFLPANGVIPLHNHPEMTVFSKLLLGSMRIKAYDWSDSNPSEELSTSSQFRLARLKVDSVFTAPCNTSVLYPTSGGNIHAFTAITPCIVLDVIGPPYSKDDGRDCTYYRDIPYPSFSKAGSEKKMEDITYGWLQEIEMPEHCGMDVIQYMGPQIV